MMSKHMFSPLALILAVALFVPTANAGWSDAAKSIGSSYADQAATSAGLPYTPSEAISGIKEVLSLGTQSAVSSLGSNGGFASNSALSIGVPDWLNTLGDTTGLFSTMNSAAEKAVPETGNIFLNAIQNLSVSDPTSLVGGGSDAITRFFESSSRDTIKTLVKPVVSKSLESAGATNYLNMLMTNPTGQSFDMTDYVTDKTLDGMFELIAAKEKSLRSGEGASELLKKLF